MCLLTVCEREGSTPNWGWTELNELWFNLIRSCHLAASTSLMAWILRTLTHIHCSAEIRTNSNVEKVPGKAIEAAASVLATGPGAAPTGEAEGGVRGDHPPSRRRCWSPPSTAHDGDLRSGWCCLSGTYQDPSSLWWRVAGAMSSGVRGGQGVGHPLAIAGVGASLAWAGWSHKMLCPQSE
jgi:hypothetical protein